MTRASEQSPKRTRYEQLLDTAAEVIAENGYSEATIQKIAEKMNVTGAALYYYVKSKDELLYNIWNRAGQRLQASLDEVIQSDDPPRKKLRNAFRAHLHVIMSEKPVFEVMILQRSKIPEFRRDDLFAAEQRYLSSLASLVAEFDPNELSVNDPTVIALGILSMLNGVLSWYSGEQRLTLDEVADIYFKMVTEGFMLPN